MILGQSLRPRGRSLTEALSDALPAIEFDRVALTIVEADRLNPLKAIEGPSETHGRILAAGEQHDLERNGMSVRGKHHAIMPPRS